MEQEQIKKVFDQLADHEKRIRVLENGGATKNHQTEQLKKKGKAKLKNRSEDLFPPIQKLLDDKFFKDWQTDLEVCSTLRIKLLTKKKPLRASVVNVLRALVKNGLLTREKVQKKKRQVFAYKQI